MEPPAAARRVCGPPSGSAAAVDWLHAAVAARCAVLFAELAPNLVDAEDVLRRAVEGGLVTVWWSQGHRIVEALVPCRRTTGQQARR